VTIEVDEVRIDVVEQGAFWLETKGDCESAAEWLDIPAACVTFPNRRQV
jgi:hypothetical protein